MSVTSRTWVVDFDGTLINLDLGAEFSQWIFARRKTTHLARFVKYFGAPMNRVFRLLDRGQVVRAWSTGLDQERIQTLVNEFLDEFDSRIFLNDSVMTLIKSEEATRKILLTGCPQELVEAFLTRRGVNTFDEVIGMTTRWGFLITRHPFGRSKVPIARRYGPFLAIGDSWSDRFVLDAAAKSYVVLRSPKLRVHMERKSWQDVPAN
jgi:phosphoserine phosphatase